MKTNSSHSEDNCWIYVYMSFPYGVKEKAGIDAVCFAGESCAGVNVHIRDRILGRNRPPLHSEV